MTTRPGAPPAPAPPQAKKSPTATIVSAVGLNITTGVEKTPDRIVIYGTGGIGKSTLAAWLPNPLFLDLEEGTRKLSVARDKATSWPMLRGKLAALELHPPEGIRSVVIDTATAAEELAKEFVIETRLTEKGKKVDSIEGFGWGKGWQFVYDEFNGLLADLDRLNAKGLIVCLVAHVVSNPVPNPTGEDFLRWEPLLNNGDKKGRGSIRDRIKNWADHLLFISYDITVEDGKGMGTGERSIYTSEAPTHMAKSRSKALALRYDLQNPSAVWHELGVR